MKFNKFALTLTAAALLPTFAYAAADEVVASFDRDLQRGAVIRPIAFMNDADPLVIVNAILNKAPDAVTASFDRDLYREPVETEVMIAGTADPLTDAIQVALYGTTDQVLASFERDLYRDGFYAVTVAAGEADPLDAINVALWKEIGDKPVAHAAIAGSRHRGS
jgi:hypothetical protein